MRLESVRVVRPRKLAKKAFLSGLHKRFFRSSAAASPLNSMFINSCFFGTVWILSGFCFNFTLLSMGLTGDTFSLRSSLSCSSSPSIVSLVHTLLILEDSEWKIFLFPLKRTRL
uniref:Transmembrane protein n=1 Tax=Trichobilharzia regenti TaxID=157069 RepID=A0AA85KBP0_TRIRE|nr:unnamed protein product [Trichobilharzia regenti]